MTSPFSPDEAILSVQSVLEMREQSIFYVITKALVNYHFSDANNDPDFQKFNKLKAIVAEWYRTKVVLLHITDQAFKKMIYFDDFKKIADHIAQGINPHINTTEYIRPVFNFYNKFSSTKYVSGNTVKDVYPTHKSHKLRSNG